MLLQPGKAPRRVTNVRDDKILTSRFWKPSFEARRCLVPASSYCELDSGKPAKWHWFLVNGDELRRLFAFPGIWQRWKGPTKKDGPNVEIDTYSFMTTAPNALTESINHERMPVLLSEDAEFETWLSGTPTEAFALARSFEPDRMRIERIREERYVGCLNEEFTMPYGSNADLPASVRDHLPNQAQDIFREAFNSAHEDHADDEEAVFKIAWAAVKRMYVKEGGEWVPRGVPG